MLWNLWLSCDNCLRDKYITSVNIRGRGRWGTMFLIRRYVYLGRTERAEVEQAQAESGYRDELSLLPAAQLRNNQSDPPRGEQRMIMNWNAKYEMRWELAKTMRSIRAVRVSDCQCRSRYSPGFDPSILEHSGTLSEGRQMKQCWLMYF